MANGNTSKIHNVQQYSKYSACLTCLIACMYMKSKTDINFNQVIKIYANNIDGFMI